MFCDRDPRRIALTFWFALWLSLQMFLFGVSPAWGFVLPHEHITRGAVDSAQWQAHAREHQIGGAVFFAKFCDGTETANAVLASVPDSASAFSMASFLTALVRDERVQIPLPRMPVATWRVATMHARELMYSPSEPPPNF